MGDRRARLGVQEDAVVADGEQARQLVADHDDGGAEAVPQLQDQVVQPLRGDRVQPRRGLVEEQDVGVERERAGEAGALAHAAGEFRGHPPAGGAEPDQGELQPHQRGDRAGVEAREHLQRQGHVLGHRHRAPERAVLEQHAEPAADLGPARLGGGPVVLAVHQDGPGGGAQQADHRPQHRALAAAAAAHHREDRAAADREVQVALDDPRAEGQRQPPGAQPVVPGPLAGHGVRSPARRRRRRRRRRAR